MRSAGAVPERGPRHTGRCDGRSPARDQARRPAHAPLPKAFDQLVPIVDTDQSLSEIIRVDMGALVHVEMSCPGCCSADRGSTRLARLQSQCLFSLPNTNSTSE